MESSAADTGSRMEKTVPIFGPLNRDLIRKYQSPTALSFQSIIKTIIETVPITAANPIPVGAGNRGTNSVQKSLPIPVMKSVPAAAAAVSLTEASIPVPDSASHTEGIKGPPTDIQNASEEAKHLGSALFFKFGGREQMDTLDAQGSPSRANDAKAEGHKLLAAGKYEDALLQFELALQIASEVHSPEFRSICHESRAICFRGLGRYADTIRESTKALGLNPKYIKALQSRGEAFGKQGNFEEAIADLKLVLILDPSNERTVRDIKYLERRLARKVEWIKRDMMRFLEPARMKEFTDSLLGHFNAGANTIRIVRNPDTGSYICVNADPVVGATRV